MLKRIPLRPYRQGDLDGLCGIYAAVNATRLALGDRAGELTIEHWQALFHTLMAAADETVGAANATISGIGSNALRKILKAAIVHMADEHDIALNISRVLNRKERPPCSELLSQVADLSDQPCTAILVSFIGHLDHWTVLRRVGSRYLELFDSSGFARVAISNCRMSYEPERVSRREHVIHPKAVFQIIAEREEAILR